MRDVVYCDLSTLLGCTCNVRSMSTLTRANPSSFFKEHHKHMFTHVRDITVGRLESATTICQLLNCHFILIIQWPSLLLRQTKWHVTPCQQKADGPLGPSLCWGMSLCSIKERPACSWIALKLAISFVFVCMFVFGPPTGTNVFCVQCARLTFTELELGDNRSPLWTYCMLGPISLS